MKYLVDTNIIIYYLDGNTDAIDFVLKHQHEIAISFITWIEVLSYDFSPEEEIIVKAFLGKFKLIAMTRSIMEQSVSVRKLKRIKMPDSIIAASAIVHKMTVVTRNTKDFSKLGLNLLDICSA